MRKLKPKETRRQCTPMTARLCPNCGVCSCPRAKGPFWEGMNQQCPLHSSRSRHAVAFHDHATGDPTECDECWREWQREKENPVVGVVIVAFWLLVAAVIVGAIIVLVL